jgi:transitional endoplasmic reticulum ATPase
MIDFKYLRACSVQQFPTWIAAVLMFAIIKDYPNLVSTKSILTYVVLTSVPLLMMLPSQSMYPQSYLSRLVWVISSATAVWIVYDLYPFYAESVVHDIFIKHNLPFNPSETPRWYWVAIGVYMLIAALMVANLGWALFGTVVYLIGEIKNGVNNSTKDSLGISLHYDEFFESFKSTSVTTASQRTDLATRDTEAMEPRLTFGDLAGQEELKEKLLNAAQEWNNDGMMNGKNGILLYGPPGTGKTTFAEALAGEIGLKFMKINVGSIASRWVNQTTEQLQDVIDSALRQAPCLLFFDEVEAILPDRRTIARGDSEEAKVVASFLSSIDKLRDGQVLVVAATNYIDRVDDAAVREGRFDFRIEVAVPDFEARKGIVLNVLKKAGKTVEPDVLDRLSRRWAGFNIPRIQEATRRAASFSKGKVVRMTDFMRGLRDVQGNKAGAPENALGLSDLYFDDELKARLENLAATFAKSDEIEARGGSVPKGIVFYGPPGTGKTTMAQALAKASGWTFIPTTGKEILSDPNKLKEIRERASDLRPSIVFIDEADDILGDRNFSGLKVYTNDLLTTIDGAGEPLHDVVWIIATNNIDGLDKAVTRRFPVKIELPVPSVEVLTKLVHDWATKHSNAIRGDLGKWAVKVARALEGLAPSVVKGILETALNNEATASVRRNEPMNITLEEVLKARREMRV